MDSIRIILVTVLYVSCLGSQATGWFPYPDLYGPEASQSETGVQSSFADPENGGLGPSATCFSDYGGNVVSYPVNCEDGNVSNLDDMSIDSKCMNLLYEFFRFYSLKIFMFLIIWS